MKSVILPVAALAALMFTQNHRDSFDQRFMLPTGKLISPVGSHVGVGSYPVNMVLSADGKYAVVSNIGYREFLTSVDVQTGKIVSQVDINGKPEKGPRYGLYYGLAVQPKTGMIFASRGAEDRIVGYTLTDGKLEESVEIRNPKGKEGKLPLHPAGIAFNSDGSKLYVANNQTDDSTNLKGSVSVIDMTTKKESARIVVNGFPFAIAALTQGKNKDKFVYVGSERDGNVEVIDATSNKVVKTIKTGAAPAAMLLNTNQSKLYVANASSDTVSEVSTDSNRTARTFMLRPSAMHGLPGATPTGLCLNSDESVLYTALNDMNAVSVTDLKNGELRGYIPTGWLPTSVLAVGKNLLVASGKGIKAQNPNNVPVGTLGQYGPNIIEGTVSLVPAPGSGQLADYSAKVIANNRIKPDLTSKTHPTFKNPGIKHVIYVIKENRTYDNVLADLAQGNGDQSICLFPREVTPNQHALAERFVLLDNFHVCAEVSQDGWEWSTSGMLSAYSSRNTYYNYSGRGRSYDTEGSNNGVPTDLLDVPDVAKPASGYIWDHCTKNGVTFRNFGFFTQFTDPNDKRFDSFNESSDNNPTKKSLQKMTNTNFRRYDLEYADSDAWVKYNSPWPKQRKTFGKFNSPSRFSEWNREFQEFVKKGEMPRFQMVRFGNDHTSGTAKGQPTPQAMVADNDYAVGQMVEAVSNSPFWKDTVICILEDDAQAGYDHVDSHRSTAYLISPWIKTGTVDHRFYNTDSMLRTMELLLGMPPMCQYDAVASPIAVFGSQMSNPEPYKAVLPSRDIITKVNGATAYRAKDSEGISLYTEESAVDEDLNDILWGAVKGPKTKRPAVKRGFLSQIAEEEDDD